MFKKNKYALKILLTVFFIVSTIIPVNSIANSVNVAQEIELGIDIFTKGIKTHNIGEFDKFFNDLDKYKSYPVHAYFIRSFINKIVEGTRDITDVKKDLIEINERANLRYDVENVFTVFDRSYISMFVAKYNYEAFPARLYAISALTDLSYLLKKHPGNPWFHLFYTIEYTSLSSSNDFDISDFKKYDPLVELRKALSIENKDPWFHYVVAQTFMTLSGNSKEIHQLAYTEFTVAKHLAENNQRLFEAVHNVYYKLIGEYQSNKKKTPFWLEEAVYTYILKKEENNYAAMNNLGFLYAKYDIKLTTAVELTGKAVAANPENASYMDSYGYALIKSGELEKGTEQLEKAYSINTEDYDLNSHLCDLYLSRNNNEKALPFLKWLREKDVKNEVINNNLAYTLAELNLDLDKALKYINSSLQFSPESSIYLDTKGWIYVKMGMFDKGLELIEKSIKINPGIGALYIHRGDIYFIKGELDKAILDYRRGITLDPAFPGIKEILEKLASIKTLNRIVLKKEADFKYNELLKIPFAYEQYSDILLQLENRLSH